MAPKAKQSAGPSKNRPASRKGVKKGVIKKKHARGNKKGKSTYDDDITEIKREAQESFNRRAAVPVIVVDEPATEAPAIEVDEIEVDEKIPRKRETSSVAENDIWTNPLKFEDLDLDVSHLDDSPNPAEVEAARYWTALEATAQNNPEEPGEEEEPANEETVTPQEPFRRKRWINKGPTINDIRDAPHDWDENEPDLHALDYDAQIERCRERIQDNIMPVLFEGKMKRFEDLKASREKVQAEREKKYPGLDVATVTRVEALLEMKTLLEKQGKDPYDQLINIKALIAAYKKGSLKWYGNQFVTYWTRGVQCSEPRGFKMEEFVCIRKHFPEKSFWVEGMNGPGSEQCGAAHAHKYVDAAISANPDTFTNYIRISVRLADGWNYTRMAFMQDTGATFMTLYENDLQYLQTMDLGVARAPGVPLPMIGCHAYATLLTIGGLETVPLTMACVCLHHEPSGDAMTCWDYIQVAVLPGQRTWSGAGPPSIPRLDGAWPRFKMFRGSAPAQADLNTTHISDKKTAMTSRIPASAALSYAFTPLSPFGPPPPPGAPIDRGDFPGNSLLRPPGFIPAGWWPGPLPLTPAGVIPTPVGALRPVVPAVAGFGGRAVPPVNPPMAAIAGLPPASFWDL